MKLDFSLQIFEKYSNVIFHGSGLCDLRSEQLVFGIKEARRSHSNRCISKGYGIILCTLSTRSVTEKLDPMQHASYIPP